MTNCLFAPPALGTVLLLSGVPGGSNKILDRSPYGNTGTITGATWVRLPDGLWCLDFDGSDDQVDLGVCSYLTLPTQFTYKFWAKSTKGVGQQSSILGSFVGSAIDINIHTDGKLRITKIDIAHILLSNNPFPDDKWTHAVVTRDDTDTWRIFLNAVDEGSTINALKPDAAGIRYIGWGSYTYFQGQIALIQVINRAWSVLEVQNSFNQEKHSFGVW